MADNRFNAGAISKRESGQNQEVKELLAGYGLPAGYLPGVLAYGLYCKETGESISVKSVKGCAAAYRERVKAGKAAAGSYNLFLTAIKRFIESHLRATGKSLQVIDAIRQELKAIKRIKINRNVNKCKVLSPAELKALQASATDKTGMFVQLLQETGCRVSELCSITLAGLEQEEPGVYRVRIIGKNSKERTLFLSVKTVEKCKVIFQSEQYLIETNTGRQYKRQQVAKMLTTAGRAAAATAKGKGIRPEVLKNVHPHMIRHSFATQCIKTGLPLYKVSKYLGHSSLQTTSEFYIHDSIKPGEALSVFGK